MLYGYARVSSVDQDLTIQKSALEAAGCTHVRSEKQSGKSMEKRAELRTLMDFLQPGDVLAVTRVDRLARSIGDLQDIVKELKAKHVSLRATEQPIDTGTAAGKCFLDMLGVFAGSRRAFGGNVSLKESQRRRPKAFIRVGSRQLMSPECGS